MSKYIRPTVEALMEEIFLSSDFDNPPITRCCNAWIRAHQAAVDKGINPVSARLRGNEAFRNHMPPLSGKENIRDFITCVGYGMAVRTVCQRQATALLYAAQVALSACKPPQNNRLRRKSTPTHPPQSQLSPSIQDT